jgi:hypothetical protein
MTPLQFANSHQANPTPFNPQAYLTWIDAAGNQHSFLFDNVLSEEWGNEATVTKFPVEQGANIADHVRVELPTCTLTVHSTNEPIGVNNFQAGVQQQVDLTPPGNDFVPDVTVLDVPVWENFVPERAIARTAAGAAFGTAGAIGADVAATILDQGIEIIVPTPVDAGLSPTPVRSAIATTLQFPQGLDFVEQTVATLTNLLGQAQLFTLQGTKQTETNMVLTSVAHSRGSDEGSGAALTLKFEQIRIVATQVVSAPIPALPRAVGQVHKGAQNPSDGTADQQKSVLLAGLQAGGELAEKALAALFGGGVTP